MSDGSEEKQAADGRSAVTDASTVVEKADAVRRNIAEAGSTLGSLERDLKARGVTSVAHVKPSLLVFSFPFVNGGHHNLVMGLSGGKKRFVCASFFKCDAAATEERVEAHAPAMNEDWTAAAFESFPPSHVDACLRQAESRGGAPSAR